MGAMKNNALLGNLFKRNSTFIGFFVVSAFGLQYFVTKGIDVLWNTHNQKRSWAYLEQNIAQWKAADEEVDVSTGSHLHGLGLVLVGDLGGGAGWGYGLLLVHVGADLSLHNGGGLLAHCQHTVEAVVVVDNLLDGQGDGGHLISEGRDADLCPDCLVGVPAVKLRCVSISMSWGVDISRDRGCEGDNNEGQHVDSTRFTLPMDPM